MKDYLVNLSRASKVTILIISDFLIGLFVWILFGSPMATYLTLNFEGDLFSIVKTQYATFLYPISLTLAVLYILGFYKSLTRFKSTEEGFLKAFIGAGIFGLTYILFFFSLQEVIEKNLLFIFIIQGLLLGSIFLSGILFSREGAKFLLGYSIKDQDAVPLIIYGAGTIGGELLKTISLDRSKKVIAFFDDDKDMHGSTKFGIPIVSKEKNLIKFKKMFPSLQIYLAIPSLSSIKRRKIIEKLEELGLSVRSVPALHEIIADSSALANLQQLSLEDLLPSGRMDDLSFDYLNHKSVFISGAGGSIGSELVRQILANNPKTLILFDQSEFNLYKVLEECKQFIIEKAIDIELHPILGDVRNFAQLEQMFSEIPIDIVFHAAAYKHVPLVEMSTNIVPSLENNVLGTFNLCKVSAKKNVKRFVLISTDKAVRPTNVMGATKRLAELVCQGFAKEHPGTIFSMVRFGNVINSSGSVIPMFREQISRGGPLTITHSDITRYFMTIPEAASLVISAGINAVGGEVFLLDMGEQIRVYDLAERMIRLSGRSVSKEKDDGGIEIIEIGLRPGEKMYEELLISGNEEKTDHDKIYKSIETSLSFEDMISVINELSESIDSININGIMSILKSKVDGYNPES